VESLLSLIKQTLAQGESLPLGNFGKFIVKDKTSLRGRGSRTKGDLQLRGRRIVVFRSSCGLRRKRNHEG
jgi:integration host factor subunit alpha